MFLDAVVDDADLSATSRDALETTIVTEDIYESARTGKRVDIEDRTATRVDDGYRDEAALFFPISPSAVDLVQSLSAVGNVEAFVDHLPRE
ncbi:hypothetical protein [Halococcus agarilyticus]|uniref:hypothetical protein n=1 Tax=Halococcus agarilyticus TaxID=1232219 RepID=UPI000677645E|nr:hypothetical protein [Halococcus agarilyticus]